VKELEDSTRCELVDAGVDVELSNLKDEVRRLQAENSALRSTMHCKHLITVCILCRDIYSTIMFYTACIDNDLSKSQNYLGFG